MTCAAVWDMIGSFLYRYQLLESRPLNRKLVVDTILGTERNVRITLIGTDELGWLVQIKVADLSGSGIGADL